MLSTKRERTKMDVVQGGGKT